MRCTLILTTCLLAFVAISCGENKSADSNTADPLVAPAAAPADNAQASNLAPAAQQTLTDNSNPIPPKDAQWTIYCYSVRDPNHVAIVKQLKDELLKTSNMKSWYILHDDQQSTLYYGYYRTNNEPQIKADREKILRMQDQVGNRPFQTA